ncbi:hypothetical protein QNN00_13690 [Bacillus velezensis]|nr:hypothetical protein [Bacillus velezensis]
MSVHKQTNRAYFSYSDSLGQEYLVPSEQTYYSVYQAIDGMKTTDGGSQTASIIEADAIASVSEREDGEHCGFNCPKSIRLKIRWKGF